jgi:anti-anti-sigma factor
MDLAERLDGFNRSHAKETAAIARARGGFDVALSGELDMQTSNALTPLLEETLHECSPGSRLVLDLSRVTYIASMGVGLLSTLMVKAEQKSVTLVLLDIPPRVRTIMDALGLLSFFNEEKRSGGGGRE